MASLIHNLGIDRLTVDERFVLMHEIWDSIATEPGVSHLSDAQREELERLLAEHEANPQDAVLWEQVKADALARFKR